MDYLATQKSSKSLNKVSLYFKIHKLILTAENKVYMFKISFRNKIICLETLVVDNKTVIETRMQIYCPKDW